MTGFIFLQCAMWANPMNAFSPNFQDMLTTERSKVDKVLRDI